MIREVVTGIGILVQVAGTLFISIDALRGQEENIRILEFVAWIVGYSNKREKSADDPLTKALLGIDPGDNARLAKKQSDVRHLNDIFVILEGAEKDAHAIDLANFQKQVDATYKKFRNRAPLIYAAITLVTLGGVLEFVGAVILGS